MELNIVPTEKAKVSIKRDMCNVNQDEIRSVFERAIQRVAGFQGVHVKADKDLSIQFETTGVIAPQSFTVCGSQAYSADNQLAQLSMKVTDYYNLLVAKGDVEQCVAWAAVVNNLQRLI